MPTTRDLLVALYPQYDNTPEPKPISRARQAYNERRAEAAKQVEGSVLLNPLRQFRAKALRVTQSYIDQLERINSKVEEYADLTPQQIANRRKIVRDAIASSVRAIVVEHNEAERKLKAQYQRREPPPYPVKADDAARIAATLAIMNASSPAEVAGIVQHLVDRDDKPALQQLLPVIRTRLGKFERDPDGTVKVMDKELGPLAAAFEDAELSLQDTGALAGQQVDEITDRVRQQVALVARTLVDEGKWEGTTAATIRVTGPDGERSTTPDLDEVPNA